MTSRQEFVDELRRRAALADALSARKMFGEYALYLDGKIVALVCDDRLFVKPTAEGRALLPNVVEAPPYVGAKPHFLVSETDDGAFLGKLLTATAAALPRPKPKPVKEGAKAPRR
jgi:TfoX/Sxy family transcriptional regulator of competence genes